jgi:hypothetical protein
MADELTAVTGEPTSGPTTARIEELRASAVRKRASVFRVVSFGPLGGSARRQVEALNEVIAIYDLAIVGRHSAARIIKAEATANTRTELAGRMRRRCAHVSAAQEGGAVMNQREAKRKAWMAAWWVLTSGPPPTSPPSPEGVCESELSAQNFARWEKAWEEVCYSVGLKGGVYD